MLLSPEAKLMSLTSWLHLHEAANTDVVIVAAMIEDPSVVFVVAIVVSPVSTLCRTLSTVRLAHPAEFVWVILRVSKS